MTFPVITHPPPPPQPTFSIIMQVPSMHTRISRRPRDPPRIMDLLRDAQWRTNTHTHMHTVCLFYRHVNPANIVAGTHCPPPTDKVTEEDASRLCCRLPGSPPARPALSSATILTRRDRRSARAGACFLLERAQ